MNRIIGGGDTRWRKPLLAYKKMQQKSMASLLTLMFPKWVAVGKELQLSYSLNEIANGHHNMPIPKEEAIFDRVSNQITMINKEYKEYVRNYK